MMILAIDPGPTESALVSYDSATRTIGRHQTMPNENLLSVLCGAGRADIALAIEMIASFGMSVGAEVFETCVWIGRFIQAWGPVPAHRVKRHEVKMYLCHSMRAKDANIRQALIDLWGGKEKAIGKKATPGPLYGIKGDEWSALAVAVTFAAKEEA